MHKFREKQNLKSYKNYIIAIEIIYIMVHNNSKQLNSMFAGITVFALLCNYNGEVFSWSYYE
uniref:Uncharacterized protein n=1 Tax=Virgibacillus oceani TaxID=1479511 RepID=A0A917M1U5_9BACI|nr:hypothetical protein GCM10011398_15470 [Virgibacillus oceani]